MKKLLIVLIIFLLSACAITTKHTVPIVNKPSVSVKKLLGTCGTPLESYFIRSLGVKVHRHKKCMGVNDLLTLVWSDELTKKNFDGITMLAIAYATHLSRQDLNATYYVVFLKNDFFWQQNHKTYVSFFKIRRKTIK
jgi:hypothetical protein